MQMSVCLRVCPSVRLCIPAKKRNNFWTGQPIGPKFWAAPSLLESNFWADDQGPGALGVGPRPQKMGFTGKA